MILWEVLGIDNSSKRSLSTLTCYRNVKFLLIISLIPPELLLDHSCTFVTEPFFDLLFNFKERITERDRIAASFVQKHSHNPETWRLTNASITAINLMVARSATEGKILLFVVEWLFHCTAHQTKQIFFLLSGSTNQVDWVHTWNHIRMNGTTSVSAVNRLHNRAVWPDTVNYIAEPTHRLRWRADE